MSTQFVSLEYAKSQSELIFIEVLMRLKSYCNKKHLTTFYNITENQLKNTQIIWRKIGFNNAGKTIKYHTNNNSTIYTIEMNINYLYSKDAKDFINFTLIHELTHIIADCYNGSFCHNKTFKTFDKILGGKGTRCHEYETPTNKPKSNRITLLCTHCGTKYSLTQYMWNKCKTGKYSCGKCHTNMKEVIEFYDL